MKRISISNRKEQRNLVSLYIKFIKDKSGEIHTIDIPRNGATNQELRKVGKTYGVKRTLEKDPPHWSLEGN